jgi:hypothetical protein
MNVACPSLPSIFIYGTVRGARFVLCEVGRPCHKGTMFECSLLLVDLLEHRPIFSPGYSAVSGPASRMLMTSHRGDVPTPAFLHTINSARVLP